MAVLLDSAAVLVDRYRLDRRLASGTVSEVWQATDLELARPVAIKILDAEFAHHAAALEQFRSVSSRASSLVHEGIVRIFDYCEPASADDPNGPFLVMELVEGPTVAETLSGQPLDARRSLDIVAQVAAALDVTHKAGLVHGDVRPQNLLITCDGIVKLVDLVPAADRDSAGTPTAAGPADDVYALGVIACQCLSGRIDERSGEPQPALPRGVPAAVAEFIQDLMATDPAARPASAGQVATRARRLRDQLGAPAGSAARTAAPPTATARPTTTRTSPGPAPHAPSPTSITPAQIAIPDVRIATVGAAGVPERARARLPLSTRVSAVILLAVAGLTGYAFLKPSSRPQADHIAHVTMVNVQAADLIGIPVPTARLRLERLGLVVHVRWLRTGQTDPGRVISVSPTGRMPVGTVITLIGSPPTPAAAQAGSRNNGAHQTRKHHAPRSAGNGSPPSPTPAPTTPTPSPIPSSSPPPSPSPPPSGSPLPPNAPLAPA